MIIDHNACEFHSSPMREACRSLNLSAIDLLTRFGASLEEQNDTTRYPITAAIELGGSSSFHEVAIVEIIRFSFKFMEFKSPQCNRWV